MLNQFYCKLMTLGITYTYFCYIFIINISLYGESYMIRNDVFRERESYMSLLERERERGRERETERER